MKLFFEEHDQDQRKSLRKMMKAHDEQETSSHKWVPYLIGGIIHIIAGSAYYLFG
ncbi:hypothetical protein [Staphylococcus pettenkoferi]|uniref:hypothetical protein n=1 Tax=Staphylococcus pettenkoferi TaxID=170573 RepID=UPI001558F13A|nr:hypothetical protein [Staphylococcus pettenkoferi]